MPQAAPANPASTALQPGLLVLHGNRTELLGDAVLALYVCERILREQGKLDGDLYTATTYSGRGFQRRS